MGIVGGLLPLLTRGGRGGARPACCIGPAALRIGSGSDTWRVPGSLKRTSGLGAQLWECAWLHSHSILRPANFKVEKTMAEVVKHMCAVSTIMPNFFFFFLSQVFFTFYFPYSSYLSLFSCALCAFLHVFPTKKPWQDPPLSPAGVFSNLLVPCLPVVFVVHIVHFNINLLYFQVMWKVRNISSEEFAYRYLCQQQGTVTKKYVFGQRVGRS